MTATAISVFDRRQLKQYPIVSDECGSHIDIEMVAATGGSAFGTRRIDRITGIP